MSERKARLFSALVAALVFAAVCVVAHATAGELEPEPVAADSVTLEQPYRPLYAQATPEADREPTPTWITVDAGPERGTAAEAPGPDEPSSSTPDAKNIDPTEDPVGFARELFDAWGDPSGHKARAIFALLLIGLVFALRRWGAKVVPWFGSERGGPILAGGLALLLGLGNALKAGATIDVDVVIALLEVAGLAMGGWSGVKHVLFPKTVPASG